jgi:hypothetical protein
VVPEDPFVQLAAGRSLFRVPDLLEVLQIVTDSDSKKPPKGAWKLEIVRHFFLLRAAVSCSLSRTR